MKRIILGNVDKTCGSLPIPSQLFCFCSNVPFLLHIPSFHLPYTLYVKFGFH